MIFQAAVNEQVCICIKRAGYNVYEPICGECRDPCALKFVVDRYATSPSDYSFLYSYCSFLLWLLSNDPETESICQ